MPLIQILKPAQTNTKTLSYENLALLTKYNNITSENEITNIMDLIQFNVSLLSVAGLI